MVALVAVIGYFYTVKPTYELKHMEQKLNELNEKYSFLKIKNDDLNRTIVDNKSLVEQLSIDKSEAEEIVAKLNSSIVSKEKIIENLQKNIYKVEKDYKHTEWNIFINSIKTECIPLNEEKYSFDELDNYDYNSNLYSEIKYTKLHSSLLNIEAPYNILLDSINTTNRIPINDMSLKNLKIFSKKYIEKYKNQLVNQISLDKYIVLKDKYNNMIRDMNDKSKENDKVFENKISKLKYELYEVGRPTKTELQKLQDEINQLYKEKSEGLNKDYKIIEEYRLKHREMMNELNIETGKKISEFINRMSRSYVESL